MERFRNRKLYLSLARGGMKKGAKNSKRQNLSNSIANSKHIPVKESINTLQEAPRNQDPTPTMRYEDKRQEKVDFILEENGNFVSELRG